jgi:tetratricopeptide (TPR) repeat protein
LKVSDTAVGVAEFDRIAATLAALTVIGLAVFLAVRNEAFASPELFFVVRVVLSFAVAVLGATIPGFLRIGQEGSRPAIRAGGALVLFVLTFVYTPDLAVGQNHSGQFDRIAAVLAALTVIGLAVFLAVRNEAFASPELFFVVRVVLSFAVAVLGATIPGFLEIEGGSAIRAGGALALFVLTFVYTPSAVEGRSDADRAAEEQRHAELLQGQGELLRGHQQILAVIAREKGVPHATLQALLLHMGEAGVSEEAVEARLRAKADEYVALRAELAQRQRGQPNAAAARARAQALLDGGDFNGARAVLAEGRGRLRTRRKETAREEAGLASEEARVARLSLRYREAATLYEEAVALVSFDPEAAWAYILDTAEALHDQGSEFGDNAALHEAIATYGRAFVLAPRAERPLDWARTQMGLGNALGVLGEREAKTARLEEAVVAHRAALQEWTRERVPLQWAMAQNSLGNALAALGKREAGTARLEEAVEAFRAALQEWTRERVPLDWATTQMNLGIALAALGWRDAGTAQLQEAVAAFEACLTVTASVWPEAWVQSVRTRREEVLAETMHRRSR